MKKLTTQERITKILSGSTFLGDAREKFAFGAAVLLLLNYNLTKSVVDRQFEAKYLKEAFMQDAQLTPQEFRFIFNDCLKSALRGGTHKVFELMLEFENDIESLKEVIIQFNPAERRFDLYSPSLNTLALKILCKVDDKEDSLIDYCSGNATLLSQAYVQNLATNLYGQETNGEFITNLKFKALGCTSYKIIKDNILEKPAFIGKHERLFLNFPTNTKVDTVGKIIDTNYSGLATLVKKHDISRIFPDWKLVNILLNSLSDSGKAVAIMSVNRLTHSRDILIREQLIKDGKIEAVIFLGNGIFKRSNMSAAMLVLSNGNKKVKLIDARNLVDSKDREQELSAENINQIEKWYLQSKSTDKYVVNLTQKQLAEKQFSINISDYIDPLEEYNFPNTATLDELVTVTRGGRFMDMNDDSNTYNSLLAKVSNIDDGKLNNLTGFNISTIEKFSTYQIIKGDILLAAKGTQIKSALVTEDYPLPVFADQNIIVLRPKNNKINSYYLNALLNSSLGEKILKSAQHGDIVVSISPNKVREIKIPIYTMYIQEKLATVYATTDHEINSLKEKLEQKQQLRDSLINELLNQK